MSNIRIRPDMERIFVSNIQIETRLDTDTMMDSMFGSRYTTQVHSYIRGLLNIEIPQIFYTDNEEDFMGSWLFWVNNPQGNKFDIGEYKGVYPTKFNIEYDYERDVNILKMEFSIDHINQYSEREKIHNLTNKQNKQNKQNKKVMFIHKEFEYFDNELFEI